MIGKNDSENEVTALFIANYSGGSICGRALKRLMSRIDWQIGESNLTCVDEES
jgi:hypothetical protein